jgi:hypothetical protein
MEDLPDLYRVHKKALHGIVTRFEPTDMDLYASLVESPLEMPEHPELILYFVNVTLPQVKYLEASVGIRVKHEGREGWNILDLCVDRFLPWIGNYFLTGWWNRKLLAKKLTLDRDGNDWTAKAILRNGRVFAHLTYKPMDVSEMKHLTPYQKETLEKGNDMRHDPLIGFARLKGRRQVQALELETIFPPKFSFQPGVVRIASERSQVWTRMLRPGAEVPGVFVKHTH